MPATTTSPLDDVRIVRLPRRRTRYVLTVTREGFIEARIPAAWSDDKVVQILHRHRRWVGARKEELAERQQKQAARAQIDWCEIPEDWWRKAARPHLWELLDVWKERMSTTVRKRRLTGAKTRWGSCNSLGDISLSWRLMLVPYELREYVVIHELAHRRHMNHSARFWNEVAKYCPDYEAKRQQLRELGGDTQ